MQKRLGTQAGAEWVPNHATDASVGSPVRFNGTWVIVRFDLEDDVIFIVESDDPRVIGEDFDAPVLVAQVGTDLLRCCKDGLFKHVVELSRTVFVGVRNASGQSLVTAVLAPGLGDGF